jgi:hypothetical protein
LAEACFAAANIAAGTRAQIQVSPCHCPRQTIERLST